MKTRLNSSLGIQSFLLPLFTIKNIPFYAPNGVFYAIYLLKNIFFSICLVYWFFFHIFAPLEPAKPLHNAQIGGSFFISVHENKLSKTLLITDSDYSASKE